MKQIKLLDEEMIKKIRGKRNVSYKRLEKFLRAFQIVLKEYLEKEEFQKMVRPAKQLIWQGDMVQCVLSQSFSSDISGNPFDYYRNLRVTNPSNYLYFYDFED